ncbi:MAG: BatA domain-containing protein, partial [Verrucomicrobia bacterium]|nr:BatA domain-containing protein [Verrucomicrobiota bacterium]
MTFLQPILLFGLPLILVPVVIHLLNRLRHRTQQWAAMRFLVAASRSSVSKAKLKQFLILLFRTLAVLMLILFLARPLSGGWMGWAFASAPDTVLILLDRSSSMETRLAATSLSRREQPLELLE